MDARKILFENWGIKLVSLVLAVTLWFYVTSKGKTQMSLAVPLELRNVPRSMAVVGDVAKNLDVRIQGQERLLRDITIGKKVFGILDLTSARVGDNLFRISPDNIRRPRGISVTHIAPFDVKIRMEPIMQKSVKLQPVLHGTPALGYEVIEASTMPAKITVEGPSSVIQPLHALRTMPINIEGATGTMTVEPRIDYRGKPVNIVEKGVTVKIKFKKEKKESK